MRNFCHVYGIGKLQISLVTCGEPTSTSYKMHDVSAFTGHLGRMNGSHTVIPRIPPRLECWSVISKLLLKTR